MKLIITILILGVSITVNSCNNPSMGHEPISEITAQNSKKETVTHCPPDQLEYEDTRKQLWEAYRKTNGNSVLEDEAYDKFMRYSQSIGHVNSWIAKVKSASVVTDGTCIIDCVDDYKNHPYTLFLTNIPTNVIRTLTRDVFISFSGEKHYDRLNGDFFKGEFNKDVTLQIVNP